MISRRDPKRIVIIKPSALGDIVQSLPVLAALRMRFPRARLTWVANQEYVPLLEPIPELDEVLAFHRRAAGRLNGLGLAHLADLFHRLRRGRFDLAIDLQGLLRTGLFTWITCAHERIGLKSAREGAARFYTKTIDDTKGSQAAVDRYWRVAEYLGAREIPKRFPLGITPAERHLAHRLVAHLPKPWLAVQPGARWETKRWQVESFAKTANRVAKRQSFSAVIVGSPGEVELCRQLEARLEMPTVQTAGKTSLRVLAALLESCSAALTNDSGPMHLAAAVGTPVIAVFTCTSPNRAGPFGSGHQVVWTDVPCRGSYLRTCDRMDCMRDVTPERVAQSLAAVLDKSRRNTDQQTA